MPLKPSKNTTEDMESEDREPEDREPEDMEAAASGPADTPVIGVTARKAGKAAGGRRNAAEQAILGILGAEDDPPALVEDSAIAARLNKLPQGDLDRLARLTALARKDAPPAPALDRLGKQLDGRLIHLDIGGNNNSVNINLAQDKTGPAGDGGRPWNKEAKRRNWPPANQRNSWGRRLSGPVRSFLGGR